VTDHSRILYALQCEANNIASGPAHRTISHLLFSEIGEDPIVSIYINCRLVIVWINEKRPTINQKGVHMAVVETRTREPRGRSALYDSSGVCRIRLDSNGSTSLVEFLDHRSREIIQAIFREVVSFRREQELAGAHPYGISVRTPYMEWFGLVLGDVFTDRFDPAELLNESDLKYAFGLRVLHESVAVRSSAESPQADASDSRGSPKMSDGDCTELRGPVEIELLLPPLWQIGNSRQADNVRGAPAESRISEGALCLLRRTSSGRWYGRILNADESKGFRRMVP